MFTKNIFKNSTSKFLATLVFVCVFSPNFASAQLSSPVNLLINNQINPTIIYGEKPSFSAEYHRATTSDGLAAIAYEIRVCTEVVCIQRWDSGKRVFTEPVLDGGRMPDVISEVIYTIDSGYNETSYSVSIKFWDENGNESLWSNPVDGYFTVSYVELPAPPRNLSATSPTSTQVLLRWFDDTYNVSSSVNEWGYILERGTDGVNYSNTIYLPSDTSTYLDTSLATNTNYYYRLHSYNEAGVAGYATTSIRTLSENERMYYLPAVRDVTLSSGGDWTAARNATTAGIQEIPDVDSVYVDSVTDFIRRSYQVIDTRSLPTDSVVVSATYYTVVNLNDCSGDTPCTPALVSMSDAVIPNIPQESDYGAFSEVLLSDTKVYDQRFYAPIVNFPFIFNASGTNYVKKGDYTVFGIRAEIDRANIMPTPGQHTYLLGGSFPNDVNRSPIFAVRVLLLDVIPSNPTDFIAAPLSSSEVSLAWTDNSVNENGYQIERSSDGILFTQIATTTPDTIDYIDSGLIAASQYNYRIRAFNAFGQSVYATTSATTLRVAPSSPTNLLTNGLIDPIDIKTPKPKFSAFFLDASSTALATSYQIQVTRNTPDWSVASWDSGKKQLIHNTPVGSRSEDISSNVLFVRDGATYYWRIKFWDQYGNEGVWSAGTDLFTMRSK